MSHFYTLSLHDALPISPVRVVRRSPVLSFARVLSVHVRGDVRCSRTARRCGARDYVERPAVYGVRSEEHTSELQSRLHLVCRLLLEKKKRESVWPAILD